MIKLLIVDDSLFFRFTIRSIVETDPEIEVIGEAEDGQAALKIMEKNRPDVVTMDVEMPNMDGIQATREIMARFPTPIIMVSNYTQEESSSTIQALEHGAVDFISKKNSMAKFELLRVNNEILTKVHFWGKNSLPFVQHRLSLEKKKRRDHADIPSGAGSEGFIAATQGAAPDTGRPAMEKVTPVTPVDLVVIGVSTGGPSVMSDFLTSTGELPCPMVIAQHMPARFTASLAYHLNRKTGLNVLEGSDGMVLKPGMVVIAPGGKNSGVVRNKDEELVLKVHEGQKTPYKPSVDLLFTTSASVALSPVAIIMTGMGDDGSKGAKDFATKGFPVLAQDPETCVVGGMPASALKAGVVNESLDLDEICERLASWSGAGRDR